MTPQDQHYAILESYGIRELSLPARERMAADLAESSISPDRLQAWLSHLEAALPGPTDVSATAGKILGDVAEAERVIASHEAHMADRAARERQRMMRRSVGFNRDLDAEERRRQRHCAESVIHLGESVEEAAARYGYPVDLVERLASEWRVKFGGGS